MIIRPDETRTLLDAGLSHLTRAESILQDEATPAAQAAIAELRAAAVLHEQYSRHLSHDLRNAITSLSGQTQLLERHLDRGQLDPDRVRQALARIAEATQQVANLARRLTV